MKAIILFLPLLILLTGNKTYAGLVIQDDGSKEKVVIFTDRTIYITGEKIQFEVILTYPENSIDSLQSRVVYCELITPNGTRVCSGKYNVCKKSAQGCLPIPKDLLSGIYYVRSYTKFLRNLGPYSYSYKQIRIVNPGKPELLTVSKNQTESNSIVDEITPGSLNAMISIVKDKAVYLPGDSVKLSLRIGAETEKEILAMCLKIIPEKTDQTVMLKFDKQDEFIENDYYPETRGLSLNGKLENISTALPVSGKRVNLSIIGDGHDFMSVSTDSTGRFFFALPAYSGYKDLFICTEKTTKDDTKIWIDNDFCTIPVNLPAPKFSLTKQERNSVQKMAVNTQINYHFNDVQEDKSIKEPVQNTAFYGKPSSVLYLDQYIQLPSLEECFNELPSSVKVRKHQGEKYFKVMGNRDLSFYTPLVLVDWVAIDEPDRILSISPNSISRIEIVNEAYVKGGQTYGGIISIISKRGDFAGIDLPSAGIFVNYDFFNDTKCSSDYNANEANLPDARNTVLWIPEVQFKGMRPTSYSALLPSTPMNYSIILQGITKSGEVLSVETLIEVKNK